MNTIIGYDLGTGGCKASLYGEQGQLLASVFQAHDTHYPHPGWHEQRPADWWQAVVSSTQELLATGGVDPTTVRGIAISGQSLAVVPLDREGNLLREYVPIWSDTRPGEQVEAFFSRFDPNRWYLTTGNGFSADCYSVFKIMWLRDNEPELFERIHTILGSKDYVNYRLTGRICTDHSYASGSGVYDLLERAYAPELLAASGLSTDLLPPIEESTHSLGTLTAEASASLGLPTSVEVFCGGVDNACMALGAGNTHEGAIYLSLGSSAWLAVSSAEPVVDDSIKPFVFAHVIPEMYTSATAIFSAGNSFRWLRDTVCGDLRLQAERDGQDVYDLMVAAAMASPIGANGLLFNPSLAGASAAYPSPRIRGALLGLELRHTQADLIRAVLEGIALDLRAMYDKLAGLVELEDAILIVGGGSKSPAWRQVFADIFGRPFIRANVGQEAASLGAAAIAAVGAGLWADFGVVDGIIEQIDVSQPDPASSALYQQVLAAYLRTWPYLAELATIVPTTLDH